MDGNQIIVPDFSLFLSKSIELNTGTELSMAFLITLCATSNQSWQNLQAVVLFHQDIPLVYNC